MSDLYDEDSLEEQVERARDYARRADEAADMWEERALKAEAELRQSGGKMREEVMSLVRFWDGYGPMSSEAHQMLDHLRALLTPR